MNTKKIIASLAFFIVALVTIFLPLMISMTVLVSTSSIILIHYLWQNHNIDFHYWASFAIQLSGLVIIAASFVLMLTGVSSWLSL